MLLKCNRVKQLNIPEAISLIRFKSGNYINFNILCKKNNDVKTSKQLAYNELEREKKKQQTKSLHEIAILFLIRERVILGLIRKKAAV